MFRCEQNASKHGHRDCSAAAAEAAKQSVKGEKQRADALATVSRMLSELYGRPSEPVDTTSGIVTGKGHSYW